MSKRPEESGPLWAAVIGGCELPAWVVGTEPRFSARRVHGCSTREPSLELLIPYRDTHPPKDFWLPLKQRGCDL